MEGSAKAPQASYSLIEGARLGRPWDRSGYPSFVCRFGNDVCCFADPDRFLIFGATRHFEHQKSQFFAPGWSCPVTEFDAFSVLLGAVVGAGFGGGVAWMVLRAGGPLAPNVKLPERPLHSWKKQKRKPRKAKDLELAAERKIAKRRESLDADVERQQQELRELEGRLDRRAEKLDVRSEEVAKQEAQAAALVGQRASALEEAENQRDQLVETRNAFRTRLEGVSGLTEEDARAQFLDEVREAYRLEALTVGRDLVEAAEEEAKDKAREITLMAIQRCAAEHVAESTVRSVKIPSDDMKGRIIGREGRNIRAIELATGVDVLIDDSPG